MKHEQSGHDFYTALLELVLTARQHLVAVGSDHGLTVIQTTTLIMLNADKPHPMKEFCGLYNCDASNVTGIIDGLEKKGLVNRESDPHDRRVKIIKLSTKGKSLQHTMLERLTADSEALISSLKQSEKQSFKRAVKKISAIRFAETVAQ